MLALHQRRQTHTHTVAVFHGAMQFLTELEQHHLYSGECRRVGA
jgi:hypothetical protein